MVGALAWPLLGEWPTRVALARLLLALTGVVLVLWRGPAPPGRCRARRRIFWRWLAIFFALTNVLSRRWRDVPEQGRVLAMFCGGLGMSLLLALGGNLALQYGAARLKAQVTALIMLAEVVIATVSSFLLGAAHPTSLVWLGGAFIMLAAVLTARR